MKKGLLHLFLLCFSVGLANICSAQTYCTPSYVDGCTSFSTDIDTFQLTGALSTSFMDNGTGCSSGGYDDRTSETPVKMYQGKSYSGYITTQASYTDHAAIWIDFNDDGTFSSSEMVDTINLVHIMDTAFTISIPASANPGKHRMRVRYVNGVLADSTIDPCSSYNYGEAHDYDVVILTDVVTPKIVGLTNDTLCSGPTVTLTASSSVPGAKYIWKGPGGFTDSTLSITLTNVTTTNSGIYSFQVDSAGYYSTIIYDTLIVKATPVAKITTNSPLCSGTNLTLSTPTSSAPGTTYHWTGPKSFTSTISSNTIKSADTTASGKYILIDSSTDGCNSTDTATVVVNETPNIIADSVVKPTSCADSNGSIILKGLVANTTFTLTYRIDGIDQTTTITANASGNVVMNNLKTGIYDSIMLMSNTCISNIVGPDTIAAASSLAAPSAGVIPPVCYNGTLSLTASSKSSGVTYKWTGPNSFASSVQNPTKSNITYADSGIYYVHTIDTSGCISLPSTVDVTVNPTPVVSITTNSPICSGSTLTISTSVVTTAPGITYHWTGPNSFTSTKSNFSITGVDTLASGKYIVLDSSSNGCGSSDTATFVVNETPHINSTSVTNPTTCADSNGAITLSGLVANTTFNVSYTLNAIPQTATITSNASGNVIMSGLKTGVYNNIMLESHTCTSNIAGPDTVVSATSPAAPKAGFTPPVCYNGTLNLTASSTEPAVTYYWTGPNSFSSTTQNPSKSSLSYADAGTYYVHTVDAVGCASLPSTVNIVVNSLPSTPTVTGNSPVCLHSTISLSASTAGTGITYSWTGPNGFTSTLSSPSISGIPFADSGNYIVYSVQNGCYSASPANYKVTIKPLPSRPFANNNSPICSGPGSTLKLFATDTTSGVSYQWTGPNSFFSTIQNPSITNPPAADSGLYIVHAILNGCTSDSGTGTNAVINNTVAPPVVTDFTYCQNSTPIAHLAATGTNLLWSTDTLGHMTTKMPPLPSDTAPGIFKWYVTQTGINGCTSLPAIETVTVHETPNAPYTTTSGYTYCQFDSAVPLSAIGQNILWYNDSVSGTGSTFVPLPSTSLPGIFYYYASQTVNGCESHKRLQITVTVKAKPSPPAVTSPIVYCQNEAASPIVASGLNLLWYTTPTGGVGSTLSPTPLTSYPNDTFYYYVTQTVNGCQSDRAQVTVIIKAKPNVLIVVSQPFVCQYDTMSFTYYGSAPATAAYEWTVPGGSHIVSGNGGGPLTVEFDSAGHLPITLIVNDDGCQSALSTYTVDVRQAPTLQLSSPKDACVGQPVPIQTSVPDGLTVNSFNWDFNGGNVLYGSTGPGPYGISWNQQGSYVVSVVAITNSCPSARVKDTIAVHPLGDAHIINVSGNNVCQEDSISFTAENYDPGYTYQWSPVNYFGLENNMGTVYGHIAETGEINLRVTTEFGCVSMDSVMITTQPCCTINFPNAFSPNGDGKNDIFRPIQGQGHHQIKKFVVVDRWGQTVFETTDQNQGWDGTMHGVPQDIGTYYWSMTYICADNKTYHESGEIILVR